jgi:PAS domain S-box-containing protein
MTAFDDRIASWTRQLSTLRRDSAKRARGMAPEDAAERALSMCDALLRDLAGAGLECEQAREARRLAEAAWDELFQRLPVPAVLTDAGGRILAANRAAARLLNVSARHLGARELMMFAEDRDGFAALIYGMSAHQRDERHRTMTFRPRERRPLSLDVVVTSLSDATERRVWFLTPAEPRASLVEAASAQTDTESAAGQ